MIKVLIIDDEPAAGNLLKLLIEKHVPMVGETIYCDSPEEALALLPTYQPTLVMLDIDMPSMNGFDFLNRAVNNSFDVIFTTAFDKYAIKAIRFSALDYLLKPIDIEELQNAINRHIVKKKFPNEQKQLVNNLIHNLRQDTNEFKFAVSVKEGVFLLEPRDIICLEGQNNYTKFIFINQKPLLVSKTIGEYEEILGDHGFYRVHKSYLVNKIHIKRLNKEGILWLSNDIQVPVSRRKRGDLFESINP